MTLFALQRLYSFERDGKISMKDEYLRILKEISFGIFIYYSAILFGKLSKWTKCPIQITSEPSKIPNFLNHILLNMPFE
jgi:hypothetical protein